MYNNRHSLYVFEQMTLLFRNGSIKKGYWLIIGLALMMTLALWQPVSAADPQRSPAQQGGRRVALISTDVACLVVNAGLPESVSATVRLEWEGNIEEAFLELAVAGSEGGHSIYVNGQRIGSAPTRPDGQSCQAGSTLPDWVSTDSIPIPAEVLTKGKNVITLTNDANINDSWTAANVHLEIHGVLSGPPVALLEKAEPTPLPPLIKAAAIVTDSFTIISTYDGVQSVAYYQKPDSYTGNPTPLLIGLHGWGSTGLYMINSTMAAEANERGWLFAAPEMHGNYYISTGKYALAWPGAQHDIIQTIEYMIANYNVDPSRIYIAGGSMGGQTTAMMAAKYPDIFPDAVPWKAITDLADWYFGGVISDNGVRKRIRRETDPSCDTKVDTDYTGGCGTPVQEPFAYQRRSPIKIPQNSRLVPIKMWHDQDDQLVGIYHSRDLRTAINNQNPITPTILVEVNEDCSPDSENYIHCYNPDPDELFDYLQSYTLNSQPPPSVTIRTDESKPYYWLNVAQTGEDHWSDVEAAYDLVNKTVTVMISDTQPLTVAFNLGSTPIAGTAGITQAGMGLPSTTYLIEGGGHNYLDDYTSGYLTVTLTSGGQLNFTASAIQVQVSANPPLIVADGITTSTLTVTVTDQLANPVPDGTSVQFTTNKGTLANGGAATISGGQGQGTLILTSEDTISGLAEVIATVGSVTGSTTVNMFNQAPELTVSVTSNPMIISSGQLVTYSYSLNNTGNVTLTNVILVDDNGTPGIPGDDVTIAVCNTITLAIGEVEDCGSRSVTVTQTITNTVEATGKDLTLNDVTGSDVATVTVRSTNQPDDKIYLPIVIKN